MAEKIIILRKFFFPFLVAHILSLTYLQMFLNPIMFDVCFHSRQAFTSKNKNHLSPHKPNLSKIKLSHKVMDKVVPIA